MNSGNIVIPAIYEKVWDFTEGLASVAEGYNKVGFIDTTGKLVIPMQDVDYRSRYYSFDNGVAILEVPETGLKGAINKEGKWILPMKGGYQTASDYIRRSNRIIHSGPHTSS